MIAAGIGCITELPGYYVYAKRTLATDMIRNTPARMMVAWNMVFSNPRRVFIDDWALPNKPPPPSLTWLKMINRIDNDTMICTMFR